MSKARIVRRKRTITKHSKNIEESSKRKNCFQQEAHNISSMVPSSVRTVNALIALIILSMLLGFSSPVGVQAVPPEPAPQHVTEVIEEENTSEETQIPEQEETEVVLLPEPELEQEPEEIEESEEPVEEIWIDETGIPNKIYLHFSRDAKFDWIPTVQESRIADDDIVVDLTDCFATNLIYEPSATLKIVMARVVYREAGNQPFLGQLMVAEDIRDRIIFGLYGSDIPAILHQGYLVEVAEDGSMHVYLGSEEVIDVTDSCIKAVEIAMQGSRVSELLLKSATEAFNEREGTTLGERYYQYGALYHYNPDLLKEKQLKSRSINRVPVAIQLAEHIFHGYWLPVTQALSIR